jgi:hypothetical protein
VTWLKASLLQVQNPSDWDQQTVRPFEQPLFEDLMEKTQNLNI